MNILAVDDEYHALELMRSAVCEVAGSSTVYLCRDVAGALQTAKQNKIDVAFLDIHMPEKNGIELARELKLINPKINIIFATGFSEHMKDGIDLRMSGYILKPVTPEAVKTELENLRNPIEWNQVKRVRILTFGNFDVFVDGEPLITNAYIAYHTHKARYSDFAEMGYKLFSVPLVFSLSPLKTRYSTL